MPLQNRVLATGEIVAHPARGLFMGNRGILHDDCQRLGRARWRHKAWVTCRLEWKGVRRPLMTPHNYTELFFLDEVVALAAGHRPCAYCRRADYNSYLAAIGHDGPVKALDDRLHYERAVPRAFAQKRHAPRVEDLPPGAVILDGVPKLVTEKRLRPIAPYRYDAPEPRPQKGLVTLLTPPTSVQALRNGYAPQMHPTAR